MFAFDTESRGGRQVKRLGSILLTAVPLALGTGLPAGATILTFDVAGGVSDHQIMPQDYGDNVAASLQAGHAYGVGAEGFTPNVVVDYGMPGEIPALWRTGYGDLVNAHFNDADGDTTFTIRFTADSGFSVQLYGFDLASFTNAGQTIQGYGVRDLSDNSTLAGAGATAVTGTTHLEVAFATLLEASALELFVDLTGLGTVSDNIAIDNIRFGQVQTAIQSVPEPQSLGLLGLALAGLATLSRRRARENREARGRTVP